MTSKATIKASAKYNYERNTESLPLYATERRPKAQPTVTYKRSVKELLKAAAETS